MRKIKIGVALLMIALTVFGYVPFTRASVNVVYASQYANMSDQEFVRMLMGTSVSGRPYWDPDFSARYAAHMNGKYTSSYSWETATYAELEYLIANNRVDVTSCLDNDAFCVLYKQYNSDKTQKEVEKLWEESKLVGDANSHGISYTKSSSVYSRPNMSGTTQYGSIYGTGIGGRHVSADEPDGIGEMIMEFLSEFAYWLADQLDGLLTQGGIALDNVIFGRVAGYGVTMDSGIQGLSTDASRNYITLFGFELEEGNPYGYVAAILFQRLRSYIYIFMALFCLYKLIRIACGGDYEQMQMDTKMFAGNAVLSFGAIVMMPYLLDVFLYVRDIILKGLTYATLDDMFGATGFLAAFRSAAAAEPTNLIVNAIYLGATVLSLFVAGIYISYAMSMMVHFIFFPAVCLQGLSDRTAYGEWAKETLSLTIMPIVDGMILLIPLTFIQMAGGNTALNLLSLIACGLLLVVRRQVKKTLRLQDNGALDSGAIATVLGLGMAARGLGKVAGKAVGKVSGGIKQAGNLMQQAKEDSKQAEIHDMEALTAPISATAGVVGSVGGDGTAVGATINGAETLSRGAVSQAKADMYRKRASQKRWKAAASVVGGFGGAAGAVGGGVVGATLGAGTTAFLGPSAQMAAMGGGASVGATVGSEVGDLTGQAGVYAGKGVMYGADALATKLNDVVPDFGAMRRNAALAGAYSTALNNGAQFDAFGEIWDQWAEYNAGEEWAGDVDSTDLPAFGDTSKGTGVGRSNAVDNKTLEIFFAMDDGRNAKDYCCAAAGAVQKMEEQPGSLMRDDSFSEKINNVKEQISSLVGRARNGEDRDELLHGVGGLDELRNNFSGAKRDKLAYDMSVNLNLMGAEYSPQSMLHRGALNSVVNHMATVTEENSAPMLQQSGRFMTAEYDKNFNIFWKEAEDLINERGVIKK